MGARISAVVDDEVAEYFRRHKEYNVSEIVRSCLREFMKDHEEVRVRVKEIQGTLPESSEFRLHGEFRMRRREWERLSEDEKGKFISQGNAKVYLELLEEGL